MRSLRTHRHAFWDRFDRSYYGRLCSMRLHESPRNRLPRRRCTATVGFKDGASCHLPLYSLENADSCPKSLTRTFRHIPPPPGKAQTYATQAEKTRISSDKYLYSLAGVAEVESERQPERLPERHVPQSLEEVDNGQIMGFGADLAEDHPGYRDQAYKDRRRDIGNLARAHSVGEPIPRLLYTAEELHVWATVLRELKGLYSQHACAEFLRCLPLFNFSEHEVPQLEDLSQILKRETGWQIQPVAGLLHPRDFLNGLAFRTFHSTQYMRHPSKPMYTPEPDVCHELLGHVPMLADKAFCDMVHSIGVASLCADDKQIWHLTKIYWFTVEFGVVEEGDDIKAFGAGILSSFGELEHMHTGRAKLLPFDPEAKQPKMSYKDGYQKHYFVLESFVKGAQQLRDYCAKITPPEVMARFMTPAP